MILVVGLRSRTAASAVNAPSTLMRTAVLNGVLSAVVAQVLEAGLIDRLCAQDSAYR